MFNVQDSFYKNFPKLVEKLPSPITNLIVRFLQKIFHEQMYKGIQSKNEHLSGMQFVDSMLDNLKITYTVKPYELQNIPATGRLIVVANHITGASDAFSLVQLIARERENHKVRLLVNGMLMGVTQASSIIIPVDNISGAITKNSLNAINEALSNDEVVVIFPSGVVNRLSLSGLKDTAWKASFLKIAKRTSTPVLPVRIESRNSILFYIISILFPKLSGLMLPHEFAIAGKMKPLHLNIGKVIPVESFSDMRVSIKEYIDMFYNHLYTLGTNRDRTLKTEITIGSPRNKKLLKEEVKKAEFLGNTIDGKRIILVDAMQSPSLLRELGRVREISFRAIGGGTGSARDNDLYDNYYRHLILWDDEELEIVGAYRIGECKDIIANKGTEGLYTYNLCDFNDHFKDYCNYSVELGRSFVQPKYWGSRALDNLWQGVGAYLAHNPNIKYTYGTVTINADTPKKAVAALVYFYSYHFTCSTNMMKAKKPYMMSDEDRVEFDGLFKDVSYKDGFVLLKSYLKDLGTSVPTLFKQYAELYDEGAVRFFDFSVNDDLFGVVEGFIIADNTRMKKAKRKRYIENFEKLKITDLSTNLYNRSYFNDVITLITKNQRRSDIDFSLVIIEVDNFEQFSDKSMKKVAETLKKLLRNNDIIARWNDREFIVMLKNVTPEESIVISSKLKDAVEDINMDGDSYVTSSVGTTMYQANENINDTLIRAENALYEEKIGIHNDTVVLPIKEAI